MVFFLISKFRIPGVASDQHGEVYSQTNMEKKSCSSALKMEGQICKIIRITSGAINYILACYLNCY